jgi:sigma-E factor negative regulatory protein RseA
MSEQISALMDDEIAVEDAEHLITSIHSSRQASQTWHQYHLIGDAMRGDVALGASFKQKLMQKIEQEPTVLAPYASKVTSNAKTEMLKDKLPASWSIAASFAAVMVVGWMALQQQSQPNPVAPVEVAKVTTTSESIPNEYLMAHQSLAPSTSSYYIQSVNYSE